LTCHLTVLSGKQFMVIAQMDPDWQMGWSVRLGAVFPLSRFDWRRGRTAA
jgi:DNA-binding IclR family transcriptional regulator